MARARKAAEAAEAEATAAGKEKREELVAAAKRDIEAETRRSLEQIRKEVADLTVLATEKVTRKSLTAEDQRRLVEEALSEVDFTALGRGSERTRQMEDAPAYMPRRSSRSPRTRESSTRSHEQLDQLADAVDGNRDLQVFFFSPYLSSAEKIEGAEAGHLGRRARADQLPRAARREAADAGDLPHPPTSSASSGSARTAASTSP